MTEKKDKKSKKKLAIISGIVSGLILIMLIGVFMIVNSPTTPAYLNIESGEVQVDFGSGWLPANDGMELALEDKVRTLDGSAILVLYESIIVNMKQNTEIIISELAEENVALRQNSGTTWNKFTKLAGVATYEVETPNTVATVRGTDFEISMDSCIVAEGQVKYANKEGHMMLGAMSKAGLVDGKIQKMDITEEDKARIIENRKNMLKSMRKVRAREINKHPTTYKAVKSFVGIDDPEAQIRVQKMDWGYMDEDKMVEKSPVRVESIEKFVGLTKEVKAEKKSLADMGYKEPEPQWLLERLEKEQVAEAERIIHPDPGVAGAKN